MLQYKTIAITNPLLKAERYKAITQAMAQENFQAVDITIQNEAQKGWTFHSIQCVTQRFVRKKKIQELLLGWIPILGNWLFPHMKDECGYGREAYINVLVFVKEV